MKFLNSYTNKKVGISLVTIQYHNKNYTGKARIHPQDEDKWSEFTGCRYAETRAKIKALKEEHKKKKAACEECRKFVKAVMQYKNFNREDPSSFAMFRQLNRRINEVNKIAEQIGKLEFSLRIAIREQESVNNRINQK